MIPTLQSSLVAVSVVDRLIKELRGIDFSCTFSVGLASLVYSKI